MKKLLANLDINQIHAFETWWQDCPPGIDSMHNFSNFPQTGSNKKKETYVNTWDKISWAVSSSCSVW
jgi:hypothetical protein